MFRTTPMFLSCLRAPTYIQLLEPAPHASTTKCTKDILAILVWLFISFPVFIKKSFITRRLLCKEHTCVLWGNNTRRSLGGNIKDSGRSGIAVRWWSFHNQSHNPSPPSLTIWPGTIIIDAILCKADVQIKTHQLERETRQQGCQELWSCPQCLLRNMCTSSFGNTVIPITIITILTPPAYCTHQEAWLDILSTTHTSHPCWLSSFLVTLLSDILNHDKVHDHLENCTNYLGKPALSSSVHSHTADILEISNYPHIIDGVQTPNTNHPYGHDHCKFKTRTKDLVT